MSNKKKFSVKERGKSFIYAFNGIKIFFTTQHNVWIHSAIAILVIISGFAFKVSTSEWCFLVFAIGFVLAAEAINTAIEFLVDLVSPKQNVNAGRIKDLVAGATLIASIAAAVIGLIIFIPKLIDLFN